MNEAELTTLIELADNPSDATSFMNNNNILANACYEEANTGQSHPLIYELIDKQKYALAKELIESNPDLIQSQSIVEVPTVFHPRNITSPLICALLSQDDFDIDFLHFLIDKGASLNDKIDGPFGLVCVWQQYVFSGEVTKLKKILSLKPDIHFFEKISGNTIFDLLEQKNERVLAWQKKMANSSFSP